MLARIPSASRDIVVFISLGKSGFGNVECKSPSTRLLRNDGHILIFHFDFELNTLVKNIDHLLDEAANIFTLASLRSLGMSDKVMLRYSSVF